MLDKQSTDRSLFSKEDNYRRLTWLGKATPNIVFVHIEVGVFPCTKVVSDPDNDPDIFRRLFREIIKPIVSLAGLKGVEPGKFLWGKRVHLFLNKEDEQPYHLSLPIR